MLTSRVAAEVRAQWQCSSTWARLSMVSRRCVTYTHFRI